MNIKLVSESDYQQIEVTRRIIANEYSHQFAILNLGESLGCYGLAWGSSIIKPIVQLSTNASILWIGVEQRLTAISLLDGSVRLSIPLHTPILQIQLVDDIIAVLTELEVMLFNSNCLLRCFLGLPDLAEEISFSGTNFIIRLLDGITLTLNPYNTTFNESPKDYFAQRDELELASSSPNP